jgi:DNA-directed RNA polymerase alpha subunit
MLDIQKAIGAPKIVETVKDDLTSSFEIRNLPRGFGHTLGNALRRIMLGYTL